MQAPSSQVVPITSARDPYVAVACIKDIACDQEATKIVACCWEGMRSLSVYDIADDTWRLSTISNKGDVIRSLFFGKNGEMVAGCHSGTVKIIDINREKVISTYHRHTNAVISACFDFDGLKIASGDLGGKVRVRDVQAQKCIRTIKRSCGNAVLDLKYGMSDQTLVICGKSTTVQLYDLREKSKKACISFFHHKEKSGIVSTIACAGNQIASGGDDGNVKIYDLTAGKTIASLVGHTGYVSTVEYSPDGQMLVSVGSDENIKLWREETKQCLATIPACEGKHPCINTITFIPRKDALQIATGGNDSKVRLWNVAVSISEITDQLSSLQLDPPVASAAFG